MGTSKSNNGPSNKTPLLPSWVPDIAEPNDNPTTGDNEDGEEQKIEPSEKDEAGHFNMPENKPSAKLTGDWGSARRNLTKFINDSTSANLKNAVKSYIRASGGKNNITKSVIIGRRTAQNFGSFLSGISRAGIRDTLSKLNIKDWAGLPAEVIFNKISDLLAPKGNTAEEAIARAAFVDAMTKLYNDFQLDVKPISSLENLSYDYIGDALIYYTSSYIFERWIYELGLKLEDKEINQAKVVNLENQARDFINASVKYEFQKIDLSNLDFNGPEGKQIITDIFKTAYILLEDL